MYMSPSKIRQLVECYLVEWQQLLRGCLILRGNLQPLDENPQQAKLDIMYTCQWTELSWTWCSRRAPLNYVCICMHVCAHIWAAEC